MNILSFYERFAAAYATLLLVLVLLAQATSLEVKGGIGLVLSIAFLLLSLVYALLRASTDRVARRKGSRPLNQRHNVHGTNAPTFEDPLRERRLDEAVVDWVGTSAEPSKDN